MAGVPASMARSSRPRRRRVAGGAGGAGEVEHPLGVVPDHPVAALHAAQRRQVRQDRPPLVGELRAGRRVAQAAARQDVGGDQAQGGDVVQGADADAAALGVPVHPGMDPVQPLPPLHRRIPAADRRAVQGQAR